MIYQVMETKESKRSIKVNSPEDIKKVLKRYYNATQEQFIVITLNGTREVIGTYIVHIGSTNRSLVHPREVLRHCLKDNACAFIVAHNHPSGNLVPSDDDNTVTKALKEAGQIMGIQLLDHIIFQDESDMYSYLSHGFDFNSEIKR